MSLGQAISRANILLACLFLPALGGQNSAHVYSQTCQRRLSLKHVDDLTRQGAFSGAREELKALLGKYPEDMEVHLAAARFYKTIGQAGAALNEYKRAIALGARTSEPLVAIAQICLANLDNKQATNYARQALVVEPSLKPAHLVLIWAQLNEGKLKEAQEELAKVFNGKEAITDPQFAYLAFRLNRQRGQLSYAKQFLDDAIKLCPQQTHWLLDRADLYQALGDESGNSTQKMRDYVEAKRALEKFLVIEPRSVEGLNKLGLVLEFYFHDFDGATRQYEKILAIDPEYVGAVTGLDRCRAKRNDLAGQMKLEFWKTLNQPLNVLRDGLAPKRSLD